MKCTDFRLIICIVAYYPDKTVYIKLDFQIEIITF